MTQGGDVMVDLKKGASWLQEHGRAIDVAHWQYTQGGPKSALIGALSRYANSDGGFGHALEPDLRIADSSVIATTVGLQYLATCGADGEESLVRDAMHYLQETYHADMHTWPIVPSNVGDAPHAPWWEPSELSEYLLNPRAEIIGYMYLWPDYFDEKLREVLCQEVLNFVSVADKLEMHEVLVVDRLFNTPGFPRDHLATFAEKFHALARTSIETNPESWQQYGMTPLTLIKHPDHPLATTMRGAIEDNLRFLSETQEPDGSWGPVWNWMGHYPDAWAEAEKDARSILTSDALRVFSAFGNNAARGNYLYSIKSHRLP